MTVPKGVAFKYVKQPENIAKMKELISAGKYVNPVFKKGDNKLMRFLRMAKNHIKQYSNYSKYYK
jgi:D-aspartate ligase